MAILDEEPWPSATHSAETSTVFEWMTDPASPPPPPVGDFTGWGIPLN